MALNAPILSEKSQEQNDCVRHACKTIKKTQNFPRTSKDDESKATASAFVQHQKRVGNLKTSPQH